MLQTSWGFATLTPKTTDERDSMAKKKLTVIALAFLFGCGSESIASDVAIVEVTRKTLETSITAQGEVALLGTGEVAFIANSLEVEEVLVNVNDVVTKGQPLIRFSSNLQERNRQREQLEHQLNDTNLLLSSQQVSLQAMRIGPTTLELENANLNITRASQGIQDANLALSQLETNIDLQQRTIEIARRDVEAAERDVEAAERGLELVYTNLIDAQTNLANIQILFNAGASTQIQLDNAKRNLEASENEIFNANTRVSNAQSRVFAVNAQLMNAQTQLQTLENQRLQVQTNISVAIDNHRIAEIQLSEIQNRTTSQQNLNAIAQQEIAIQRTQLAITDIERNIANLEDVEEYLFSPATGTITSINVVAGSIAQAGAPLVQINDPESYVIRAFINERHVSQIALGQPVLVEGSILAGQVLHGSVQNISTIATNIGVNERVIPIEINVDNLDTTLLIPGVTLDVTVTTDVRENVVSIPLLATLVDPNGTFVFVTNENLLEQRFIQIITHADMYIEVEGLYQGEFIVAQPLPAPMMYPGMLVNPININEPQSEEYTLTNVNETQVEEYTLININEPQGEE